MRLILVVIRRTTIYRGLALINNRILRRRICELGTITDSGLHISFLLAYRSDLTSTQRRRLITQLRIRLGILDSYRQRSAPISAIEAMTLYDMLMTSIDITTRRLLTEDDLLTDQTITEAVDRCT